MTTAIAVAVVIFCLGAATICLILAIIFTFQDRAAATQVRDAAKRASEGVRPSTSGGQPPNPATVQGAGVDFGGIAKLAEALDKLNPSGRFLLAAITFAAAAAVIVSVGTATT